MQKTTELLEPYEPKTHKLKYSSADQEQTPGILKTNTEHVRHQMHTTATQNS